MATQTTLEILLKAQDQTRAAFEGVQKSNERIAEQVDKINKTVSDAGESAVATGAKFGVGFEVATKVLEKVVNTAVECAKAIGRLAERAEEIQNKAAITGFSTDSVQGLERLATNAGVSSEAVFRAISRMQRAAVDGKKGFTDLGIEGGKFLQMMPEDQLQAVAERIMALPTAAERAAAAMDLFGRSGAELLPILDDIAKDSDELQVSLSEEQVEALADLDDALDRTKGAFSDFGEQILATIATSPAVSLAINDIATAVSWLAGQVKENQPALRAYVELLARAAGLAGPNSPLGALRLIGIATEGLPKPATPTGFGMEAPSGMPAGPSIAEQYAEKAWLAQVKYDELRAASARKLQAELERLEQRQIDGAMKVEAAQLKSLDDLDKADAAFTRNRMANEEQIIAAENRAVEAQLNAEARLSAQMAAEEARRLADAERAAEQRRQAMARVIDEIGTLFMELGVKADSALGMAIGGMQNLANAGLGAMDALAQLASGNIWGAIASGIGVITAAVSGLKKLWDSIFGQSEIEKTNDARDAFFAQWEDGYIGVQRALVETMGAVGEEDWVKELFDAKSLEDLDAVIAKIREAIEALGKDIPPVTIPVSYETPGAPPGGGWESEAPAMARGGIVLPFVPRAARGLYAPARPGGMLARIAEGGEAEVVAPVRAILAAAERIGVAAAQRGGGPGGDVYLDGQFVGKWFERRSKAGLLVVR